MIGYVALKILQIAFWLTNWFMYNVMGYSLACGSKKEKSLSATYEYSAHVMKVLYRAARNGDWDVWCWKVPSSNMLCVHVQYCHPKCVLEDNISLFGLSKDTAYFAVASSHVDFYSSKVNSFFACAQFWNMTHLISMPISSFHRIAGRTGEPKSDVVLLSSTGRCGSTLFTQLFEALPNFRTISEPLPLVNLLRMYNAGQTSDEENRKIVRSSILLLCKRVKEKNIECIIIKIGGSCPIFVEIIWKYCSFVRHVFLYRHPKNCILSYYSMFHADPIGYCKHAISNIPMVEKNYQEENKDVVSNGYIYELIAVQWAQTCSWVLEYRRKGITIKSFNYEELLKEPAQTVSSLFAYLGIKEELVPLALTAMKKDSQQNSYISKSILRRHRLNSFTSEQLYIVNKVLQNFGFPPLSQFSMSCLK